jgi:cysteine synthase
MLLLQEAERRLRALVVSRDTDGAVALMMRVVRERTEAMHLRAQAAESRAFKAERNLNRMVHGVEEEE